MSSATIPIIEAIRSRRLLEFRYDGGKRVVEPHTFGIDKYNREMLCGYQTGGASKSAKPVGWKFFLVAKLSGLRATDEHFATPRPEYQHNDGAFLKIVAQL
jgi:hypothetical protein